MVRYWDYLTLGVHGAPPLDPLDWESSAPQIPGWVPGLQGPPPVFRGWGSGRRRPPRDSRVEVAIEWLLLVA